MRTLASLYFAGVFFCHAATAWTFIEIGTLGGNTSEARRINDRGMIVGGADTAQGDRHAFRYNSKTQKMRDLGTLGGPTSMAWGINIQNQVVGEADRPDGSRHAVLWRDGLKIDLGTLGGRNSVARAINDFGQIVGSSETSSGERHAFIYRNGKMYDLGTLGGPLSGANDINNLSQIVGESCPTSSCGYFGYEAFIYQNGTMTRMGTLGWGNSSATGINSSGNALVWSNGGGADIAVGVYRNGTLSAVGSAALSGWVTTGFFHGMNDAGKFVGFYHPNGNYSLLAPYFHDGAFRPVSVPGMSQVEFHSINNADWICGFGISGASGKQRALLVKP